MLNLLALETATAVCSVALLQDHHVTVELTLDRPRAHAENLVSMIGDALRYGHLKAPDVDAVAVSSGPGSYTGLRIGVSTAKGLAAAVDAELVSVPSLTALASSLSGRRAGDRIAAAFDARRDEVYAAIYQIDGDTKLLPLSETAAVRRDDVVGWLRRPSEHQDGAPRLYLVGDGWMKMIDALDDAGIRFEHARRVKPNARSVALLGSQTLESGHAEDLLTFEPYYLKDFVAGSPGATPFEKLSF